MPLTNGTTIKSFFVIFGEMSVLTFVLQLLRNFDLFTNTFFNLSFIVQY